MDEQWHDLPTRQHTKSSQIDIFSSRLSEAPTLSPTDATHTTPHERDQRKTDARHQNPLFKRRFGWARPHTTEENETRGPLGLRCLFCSPEPLIDLVFVHGLRGGSIKTWRRGNDPQLFWPQRWLPLEPEFSNASIHTFGYDSDWGSTKPSILNVHDFGRSLYEELQSSPLLRHKSKKRPIVLIGYSMGGLVIKKAYILAHQDHTHRELSERIRCMFFLATPHRGSDYAALLNRILKVCGITGLPSSKEYIRDLTLGSTSTQLINDDFAKYTDNLVIYSFYETLPTIGVSSTLIVNKNSAILGLNPRNEHVQYLHANHREICKFSSMEDSNYVTLKNALATAIEDLLKDVLISNEQSSKEQLREIQDLLGISSLPEEQHDKLEGSCQWIEEREDFQKWIEPESDDNKARSYCPSIFWVQAHPGAGKTVLAAHVVLRLAEFRLPYTSYFFHFGKKSTQSLAGLLRSMAYQMASTNAAIRDRLTQLNENGTSFDHDNARAIWTKIFKGGIFQVPIITPQSWVVDALDECVKYPEFITLLKDTQTQFPLRIFITSRKLSNMSRLIRQLEDCDITIVQIPIEDTMRDIELYIRNRIADLPIDGEEEREELARKILAKSDASFLWVRLVMDELEGVYGYESISQVLQGIPEGMLSYYERAVTEMAEKKREQHIAKAILLWTVLPARPLSVSELSQALQLDIDVHLPSAKSAIEGLCGQLVSVDLHTNMVQLVHATAREFILSDAAGDFQISKSKGHETIALTCLRLLSSPDMQPPRHRRLLDEKRPKPSTSALMDYATTQYSEHIFAASAESDQLLVALNTFLSTNVLSWIEAVVAKKNIHLLIRTAKNLKGYLDRRAKYLSPLNRHVHNIESWATDLSRISSKFGRALTSYPQSAYFLIPPLCPTQSAVYRQFGHSPDGLMLSGSRYTDWDDCLAHIHFEDETATAISCGNSLIAVGTESGNIHLYNYRSYQKEMILEHGLPVDLVRFDPLGAFLAACSRKLVMVWELDGSLRWKTHIRSRCIILSSSQTALIGVTQRGRSYRWDIDSGELLEEQSYIYQAPDSDAGSNSTAGKAPSTASLSPGMDLLALAYRNSPVCIFEFGSGSLIGWATDKNLRAAEQLVFNPNPDVNLLLVSYNESHLALYDPWSGALIESSEAERPAIITSISCSSDGRTFATIDILGHLRIWDFESLTLLYHVLTPSTSFSLLEFTSDGFNLVKVVDHEMRIWAPSALVRKTVEEEASTSDQAAVLPVTEGQFETFQASKINALVAHPHLPMLFAGNYNGDILGYHSGNEYQSSVLLYSHRDAIVKCLAVSDTNLIASADMHTNLQVWQIHTSQSAIVTADKIVFKAHFTAPICQLLFDMSGAYLLVSTIEADHVYRTADGSRVGSLEFGIDGRSIWRWFVAPLSFFDRQFLLIAEHKLVGYSIDQFPAVPHPEELLLDYRTSEGFMEIGIDSVTYQPETSSIILEVRQQRGYGSHSSTFIFTIAASPSPVSRPTLRPTSRLPQNLCAHFIGVNRTNKRLIFLHQESWICSIDSMELSELRYTQHFFVPHEYMPTNSDILPVQTTNGDFAFCLFDKIVVVKNGLKFQTTQKLSHRQNTGVDL